MRPNSLPNILSIVIVLLVSFRPVEAGLRRPWTYQDRYEKADAVVIATPLLSRDSNESKRLEELDSPPGKPNTADEVKAIGVNTEFTVLLVLKGKVDRKFVLHHYRLSTPPKVAIVNGPDFVQFEPNKWKSFLLFLNKEADGTYTPVTGQLDARGLSVIELKGTVE